MSKEQEQRIYDSCILRVGQLEEENAKLRELVKEAWGCIHAGVSCFDCRMVAFGCTLQTAMQELGIEVE